MTSWSVPHRPSLPPFRFMLPVRAPTPTKSTYKSEHIHAGQLLKVNKLSQLLKVEVQIMPRLGQSQLLKVKKIPQGREGANSN